MNSRRTVIIAVALVLAVVAFAGNVAFLNSAQDRANDNATLVKVYKVTKDIPKGLEGSQAIAQDYVRVGEIPQEFRPGTAIADINDIKGKVAINNLSPGQVVVSGQFVDPAAAQVTFSQRVPAGQVAVSVSVDQVHGVAGLLLPGDKVNLMVVEQNQGSTGSTVSMLYQNVNILAIGTKAALQAGESAQDGSNAQPTGDSGLITFAVPAEAAQRIILGTQAPYQLYLSLVAPENQPADIAPVSKGNIDDPRNTPYPDNR